MKTLSDNEQLHADLFLDPRASAEILRATVRTASRRRHRQVATRAALVVLFLAALLFPLTHQPPPRTESITARTQPALPHRVLHSHSLEARISTTAFPAPLHITTIPASAGTFTTASFGPTSVHPLTDEQLLAFFHGQAIALVRPAAHEAELLFLDTAGP